MPTDDSSILDNAGKKCIQPAVSNILYYAWAIDLTILMQWKQDISGSWMEKHNNTSSFIISPVKKTWAIIHLNTTQQTFTSMSGHIMCIPTSPLLSSPRPLSPSFGEGVLKSWGTHMPRSPHYHVLGSLLGSLSPQAFLVTKYWASLAYSIGYHLLTSIQEEYH
jgi:hypothetical protein